jgi:hypothetical protein
MPNNIRIKKVPIKLDKKRHLLYDLNAYCELENYYNQVDGPGDRLGNIITEINKLVTSMDEKTDIKQIKTQLSAIVDRNPNGFSAFYRSFLNGSPNAIRALLWAGLIHEDENLTIKDVGKMVGSNLNEISLKIIEAMSESLPEPDEDDAKN